MVFPELIFRENSRRSVVSFVFLLRFLHGFFVGFLSLERKGNSSVSPEIQNERKANASELTNFPLNSDEP